MDIFKALTEAVNQANKIMELSGMSGEFFAMLLVADLNKLENSILDGLAKYDEAKKENPNIPDIDTKNVGDKASLIGCQCVS